VEHKRYVENETDNVKNFGNQNVLVTIYFQFMKKKSPLLSDMFRMIWS